MGSFSTLFAEWETDDVRKKKDKNSCSDESKRLNRDIVQRQGDEDRDSKESTSVHAGAGAET
jgi:hypothetical protein